MNGRRGRRNLSDDGLFRFAVRDNANRPRSVNLNANANERNPVKGFLRLLDAIVTGDILCRLEEVFAFRLRDLNF